MTSQSSSVKKRKVDSENRAFQEEWTENYFFILNSKANKPQCLICNTCIALIKSSNVKRHYQQNHENYEKEYPTGSTARAEKIEKLKKNFHHQQNKMVKFTTVQQRATRASFHISTIMAKHMLPYSHSDIIKEILIEAVSLMFPDKKDVIEGIKTIALSRNTTTRRVEDIAENLKKQIIKDLMKVDNFSLAIDESTDINDVAQLAVFVR